MPANVTRFEILMYVSLGIGLATFTVQSEQSDATWQFVLANQAFVSLTTLTLVWLIARRRKNWARWLSFALFLLGVVPFTFTIGADLRFNHFLGLLKILQLASQGIAFYFIFSGDAVHWFKRA